jgi:thioredoxin
MAVKQVSAAEWDAAVTRRSGWVLVDFYAVWCPPCRALAPLLERLAAEWEGRVEVLKVDTDAEEDLASRLGVRTLPTLIAFRDGVEVDRAINPQSRGRIEDLVAD